MSSLKWTRYAGQYSADAGQYKLTINRGHDARLGDHWVWRVWKGTAVVAGGTKVLLAMAKAFSADAVEAAHRREVSHV